MVPVDHSLTSHSLAVPAFGDSLRSSGILHEIAAVCLRWTPQ